MLVKMDETFEKDTLIGRITNKDFAGLNKDMEALIGKKIADRIKLKQVEITKKFNGINEAIEMGDVMSKISMGEKLSDKEKKILSAAIDSAKGNDEDDSIDGEVLDAIMKKVSAGEELTDDETDILSVALEMASEGVYSKKKKK